MQWQEFIPGEMPPKVVEETGEGMLDDMGMDEEVDPSVTVGVQLDPEVNGAVLFSPLPERTPGVYDEKGLFNSK